MFQDAPPDPVVKLDAKRVAAKTASAAGAKVDPLSINHESQLFIDDHLVESSTSLHRRLNKPVKEAEPFLTPCQPWEGQGLFFGTVIPHEGKYRLYYRSGHNTKLPNSKFQAERGYSKSPMGLALSDDARHFTREPVEDAAIPGTNVVMNDLIDDFNIHRDDQETDPQKRFKLLCSRANWVNGLTPATSPDGIRWTFGEENAVINLGDRCSYWYDPIRQVHVAWSRCYPVYPGRAIVQKETADFDNWADPRKSHPALLMAPDRQDHPDTGIYGAYPFWYRSLYIAYVEVFYYHAQRIDTQLAYSRDGRNWTRLCDRDVFLSNGPHGSFDAYWAVPTFNPPILQDGQLLIHYNGRSQPHTAPGFKAVAPGSGGAFCLSTLREDGFVSLDATGNEGTLLSKPLALPEARKGIAINVCPFATHPGYDPMKVQLNIFSEEMECLESYLIEAPNTSKDVWRNIRFETELPPVVRLQFQMTNARLYSFRILAE